MAATHSGQPARPGNHNFTTSEVTTVSAEAAAVAAAVAAAAAVTAVSVVAGAVSSSKKNGFLFSSLLLNWMFEHDCLDTCCFGCLTCMCFVFLYLHLFSAVEHVSHGKTL